MKKFLKIFLISLASFIILVVITGGVLSWLVFTPDKLTPIVRKQAAKYILCPSEIGEVELTFFSTFPQFGLRASRLTLINPVEGAPSDTLLNAKELTGIINIKALIKHNELIVSDFRLSDGNLCVYIDVNGAANFDIFGDAASEPDTAQTELIFKVIDIENVDLNNMNLLYVDESMNLKADVRRLSAKIGGSMQAGDIVGAVNAKPFDLSLEYRPDESSVINAEIRHLSAKIDGSMKSGAVTAALVINPFDLTLHYGSDSLSFATGVRNLSAAISGWLDGDSVSGKIRLEPFLLTFALGNEEYLHDALVGLNVVAAASLSRLCINVNTEKSGVGSLEDESVVFLGHKIDSISVDACAKGWKRFARALDKLENARTTEEATQARALLSSLKSFYRNAGKIG